MTNHKSQTNLNIQIQNSKRVQFGALVIEIWCLGFGISEIIGNSPEF
jgi:hypothetical protein